MTDPPAAASVARNRPRRASRTSRHTNADIRATERSAESGNENASATAGEQQLERLLDGLPRAVEREPVGHDHHALARVGVPPEHGRE
jgi:HEPN domain-containing protein